MKRFFFAVLSIFFLLGLGRAALPQERERDPFRAEFDDQIVRIRPGDRLTFTVRFKIPKGFYLYDEKTSVLFDRTADLALLKTERPDPTPHEDPFLKKVTQVFFNDFAVKVFFLAPPEIPPGRRTLEGTLRYQGCSDDFCYKPVKKTFLLPVDVIAAGETIQAPPPTGISGKRTSEADRPGFMDWVRETNPEKLLNQGKIYLLGLAFVGGVLTSFTPCVLPIVPLTLAFIGVKHRRRGNALRALALVLGMVVMYSLLGFLAASLGLSLGFLFQSRYFVLLTALFFFIFALGLFEVIPFHLPPKWHNRLVRAGGEGPWGAFIAGLTVGLIASPCVGPLIAPLLLIAARAQDRIYGFTLLLFYGLGMGLLFVVLGSAYAELAGKVKSGRWTHRLKKILGVLMLGPAIYYGLAFTKPFLEKPRDDLWVYDFAAGLQRAQAEGKPILLDFYAEWCPPCLELDKRTFSAPEVRGKAGAFVMLKVDCTVDDAQCRRATERYEVVGWPTVLFLRSDGTPIEDVKLVGGFAGKEQMVELMDRALHSVKSE
jgi:thiol:disulfide interchange protein DsbD